MKNYTYLSIAAAISASLLASCANGPEYPSLIKSGTLTPHNGKGMVLIYRTSGFAGAASKPFVWVNNTKMPGQLARGGFYSYEAAPGPLKVEFSWHDHRAGVGETIAIGATTGLVGIALDALGHGRVGLDLLVVPNQTHYVLMDGRHLSLVPSGEAEPDIADCHWLNP
jgi:hypothetical protein